MCLRIVFMVFLCGCGSSVFFACIKGDSVWQEKEYVYGYLVYGYDVERCMKEDTKEWILF